MNVEEEDSKPAAGTTPSDEERRKLLKPSITSEQAVTIMKNLYAKNQDDKIEILTELDSYDDVNFRVALNGTPHLLKIHNGVESDDFLRVYEQADHKYKTKGYMGSVVHLQTAMMDLLSTNKVPTSAPVPTKDGMPVGLQDLAVVSPAHSPRQLVVRLLTWVNGKLMSAVPVMPIETLADCGRLLGRVHSVFNMLDEGNLQSVNILQGASKGMTRRASALHIQSEAKEEMVKHDKIRQAQLWKIPESGLDLSLLKAARRYHQWDGKHTSDLRPFTQYIQDEKRRELVLSVIHAFKQEIIDSGDAASFRVGVNHGDFNDANILLKDDMLALGVIDFGDSVESWRVLDVTVAMAYAMLSTYGKANRGMSAAAAMLRGYQAVRPLLPVERKHLVLLVACRLACSTTLGAYSYQQNPENTYLLLHSEPAWKALEMIWPYEENKRAHTRDAFNRVLDQACLSSAIKSKIIDCSDLVFADPAVEDLLAPVRMRSSFEQVPPSPKKRRISTQGLPIITFVTGNIKKLIEVRQILGISVEAQDSSLPFSMDHHKLDLPELQGDTIDIAKQKCRLAAAKVGGAVITEDTSLCFNALQGLPGPYIKWFLDRCGHEGLNKMLDGYDDRSGYAQTVVCFCAGPGKDVAVFDGRTNGKIVRPRGPANFGWDPIFEPSDNNPGKTYAEMTAEEKNAISHRSRAMVQLREFLRAQAAVLRDQIV